MRSPLAPNARLTRAAWAGVDVPAKRPWRLVETRRVIVSSFRWRLPRPLPLLLGAMAS